MKISVAIPTYEMHGFGASFLEDSFSRLEKQTFKDFEVVVSDHSRFDNSVMNLCWDWRKKLNLLYFRNKDKIGSSSANINNAIKNSNGEWIKILFQDDFLYGFDSLQKLSDFIDNNRDSKWIASACQHTNNGYDSYREFYPSWNPRMSQGVNTLSSPSVISIRNIKGGNLQFNEDLLWMMDVDFYCRMKEKYGEPSYLNEITVVNRTWKGSLSNTLSEEVKKKEERLFQ